VAHHYFLHQNWDFNNSHLTQLTQYNHQRCLQGSRHPSTQQQVRQVAALLQQIARKTRKLPGFPRKSVTSFTWISVSPFTWRQRKQGQRSVMWYAALTCKQARSWSLHQAFQRIFRSLP